MTEKPITATDLVRQFVELHENDRATYDDIEAVVAQAKAHLAEQGERKETFLFMWDANGEYQYRMRGEAVELVHGLLSGALSYELIARILMHAAAEWLHAKGLKDIADQIMERVTLQHLTPQTTRTHNEETA